MKQHWPAGTMISPLPAIIVTACDSEGRSNLFTASWTGILNSEPPMCYVSIRPERFSYPMVKETMQFALNLTTPAMAKATDLVGVTSGRKGDKWATSGLTPCKAKIISCPLVEESPVSLECRVREIVPLGSHDLFIADIVSVAVDDAYINPETGKMDLKKSDLLVYAHGEYFSLGDFIGYFGWSLKKGSDPIVRRD